MILFSISGSNSFPTFQASVVTPPTSSDEEMSYDSNPSHEAYLYQPMSAPLSQPQALPLSFASYAGANSMTFSPLSSNYGAPLMSLRPEADRILDEAVEELFLTENGDADNLAEFVNDWDPSESFGEGLNDDAQLGFLLDKLLED